MLNFFLIDLAGIVESTTTTPYAYGGALTTDKYRVRLADIGKRNLKRISARAEIRNLTPADMVRLEIQFRDQTGAFISNVVGTYIDDQSFQLQKIERASVPSNAVFVELIMRRQNGTGTIEMRDGMLGEDVEDYQLPWRSENGFSIIDNLTDITVEPDEPAQSNVTLSGRVQTAHSVYHRWFYRCAFRVMKSAIRFFEADVRSLKYGKTFNFIDPIRYKNSTGLRSLAAVNGASQAGNSLDVDGLPSDTMVIQQGDYFSVQINSRWQLFQCIEDAITNGLGEATLQFEPELRGSPADNAVVRMSDAIVTATPASQLIPIHNVDGFTTISTLDVAEKY